VALMSSSSSLQVAANASRNGASRSNNKRKVDEVNIGNDDDDDNNDHTSLFHATATASQATSLTDGVLLKSSLLSSSSSSSPLPSVVLPWIGYGTYKLGKQKVRSCTLEALKQGYRMIDTAFIYGGETTETQVGLAIEDAIRKRVLQHGREELVVVTKHWRKYHGYEQTNECLRLSLKRLNLDYIDLYLMHWPGPAWSTMNRRKDEIAKHGRWHYATHSKDELPTLRAETWRAMEEALKTGKVKAIGVCNFTIDHLKELKKTATVWPPAVNQIECHPIFPQQSLLDYCADEGIVVQAYSSLGGQDAGKKFWTSLYPLQKGQRKEEAVTRLTEAPPVVELAAKVGRTPSQVLLRWGLEKNLVLIPKTERKQRMIENAKVFDFSLSKEQVDSLDVQLQKALKDAAQREGRDIQSMSRLAWRNDPLRDLDFD
jgi:diketogulonate reductase-like aldo/keto reductase